MSEIMGKRLKYLREKREVAQKHVAEKIGVKSNTLSGYESGRREPDSETLRKLADYYGVSTDYLHGRTDNYYQTNSDTHSVLKENENEFNSIAELNKLIKEYGIEQMGFFDIEKWKKLGPEDIDEIRRHFEWVVAKAKQLEDESNNN